MIGAFAHLGTGEGHHVELITLNREDALLGVDPGRVQLDVLTLLRANSCYSVLEIVPARVTRASEAKKRQRVMDVGRCEMIVVGHASQCPCVI